MDDLRCALQSLRRSPSFTLIAIVTLALGIGANTSAFSVLNALLLKPLPYPECERLERVYRVTSQSPRGGVSPADYLELRAQAQAYGALAAYAVTEMNLAEPGRPAEALLGLRVSADLWDVLGTVPSLGRGFRADEETPGNERVLVLSDRLWRQRFGGDERIVGRSVRVGGEAHEIVGVLPPALNDWRHLGAYDLFRPLAFTEQERRDRGATWLRLVGRRSAGLGRAQGEAFIGAFGRRQAAAFPALHAGTTWRTLPLYDSAIPENAHGIVGLLIGLSAFVLLIACSNLANLLLARTVARARELAVRSALGASRFRLLRPLVVEVLLVALAGGVGALQVALATHDWLNSFAALEAGDPPIFALDWRVLAWAFGACLVTALVFGVAPALFALRLDPNGTLKSGARGATSGRGQQRFRRLLIGGQFALALVLLVGAAFFLRGLRAWNERRFGWESEALITGTLALPTAGYPDSRAVTEFQRLVLERLAGLPGVASASLSYSLPFFGLGEPRKYVVAGQPPPPPGREPVAVTNGVSGRYFETLGTPLLAGRMFGAGDTLDAPRVFIVNRSLAQALFGPGEPVGKRLARAGEHPVWGEIVGVVADIRPVASDSTGSAYQVYQPLAQEPRRASEIAVRSAGVAPATLRESIRAAVMGLDPDLPVRELQPASVAIGRAANYQRIIGRCLTFLAALGLGLACLGVYGVIARSVAQRTGEFGIRMALGAERADIVRLVLASGAKLVLAGSAVGLLGALGTTRLIVAGFPGLQANSAPVVAGATLLLLVVAQVASYVPARRAARISPSEALRAE